MWSVESLLECAPIFPPCISSIVKYFLIFQWYFNLKNFVPSIRSLAGNNIGPGGAKALAEALHSYQTVLRSMLMGQCPQSQLPHILTNQWCMRFIVTCKFDYEMSFHNVFLPYNIFFYLFLLLSLDFLLRCIGEYIIPQKWSISHPCKVGFPLFSPSWLQPGARWE